MREYDVIRVIQRSALEAGARLGISRQQILDLVSNVDEALRAELGTSYPYIPTAGLDPEGRAQRNAEILARANAGDSFDSIARAHGLSVGWVKELVRGLRQTAC